MLGLILKRKPLHPRGEFNYSNLGFVVAAAMLEKVTGQAFETMMRDSIFKPLEMDSADFRSMQTAARLKAPLLWGHYKDGTPVDPRTAGSENPTVYASCGTVHLSIADYAKYARWHLKEEPAPVLSDQATVKHLHSGYVDHPAGGGKYGCGWIHLGRAMTHGGSNTNSQALIWVFPSMGFAAVVCTNSDEPAAFPASNEVIEIMMKRYAK